MNYKLVNDRLAVKSIYICVCMFVCVCINIKLQNKEKILITTQHLHVISLINLKRLYLHGEKFYIAHVLVQRLSLKTEKFLMTVDKSCCCVNIVTFLVKT